MEKYQIEPEFEQIIGDEFGQNIEIMAIAIKESRWFQFFNVKTGGSIVTAPAILGKKLYFGACDHNFYCLDIKTGEKIWQFATDDVILSSPKIDNDIIYFGSYDGNFYALNLDGKLVWKFEVGDKIASSPFIYKDVIYFGSRNGNLYAINNKGQLMWKFQTASPISATVVVKDDMIYFGNYDGNFFILSTDGQCLLKKSFSEPIGYHPIIHKTSIIVAAGQTIYCMNMEGDIIWKFVAGDLIYQPILANDVIYFGSRDCNLYAITLDKNLVWKWKAPNIINFVAATDDRVFAACWDGDVYCFDAKNGKKLWTFSVHSMVPCPLEDPCVHEGVIYFGSWDCRLYALTINGELLWEFKSAISAPSSIEIESPMERRIEVVWKATTEETKKEKIEEETDIADYGTFSGKYVDISKSDYLGRRKKGYM